MLHRNVPRNNRIRSETFPLFMNLNPDGEGPHQWNFNSIIYCLGQNVNRHSHIILCAQKMRRTDLTCPLTIVIISIIIKQPTLKT